MFNFGLSYNQGPDPLYNGNISRTEWRSDNQDKNLKSYAYSYDPLNRIIEATDNTSNYNLSNVTYDKNGNILTLDRTGHTNTGATTFGNMDDLGYVYNSGNKLLKVTDGISGTAGEGGFKDGTNSNDDFEYDENGNLEIDRNKGITSITYNHLNLPDQVNFGSDNIKYVYDADGMKLKRTSSTGTETLYAGNYIYEGAIGNAELQFFDHPEGYVTPDGQGGYDYNYNYVDHLGSVRLSYTDADGNGSIDPANEIIEENNYYAFGLKMLGFNSNVSSLGNSAAKRWKYNGKEMDGTFDIDTYDFGARNYDPAIGRWMNLDPLAEQMRRHSPYNYAFNNPIFFIDSDGMAPDSWYRDEDGNVQHTDQATSEEEFNNSGLEGEYIAEEFVGIDQNQGVTKFNKDGTTSSSNQDEIGEGDKVVAVTQNAETIPGSEESKASGSRATQLGAAAIVSQGDSPLLGPGDVLALGMLAKVLHNMITGLDEVQTSMQTLNFAKDSSPNERHGDRNAESKVERQLANLEAQLQTATGNAKKKIKTKIQNVKKTARDNKKGESHSRKTKRK